MHVGSDKKGPMKGAVASLKLAGPNRSSAVQSDASDNIDLISVKTNIARSKNLIGSATEDLNQYQLWIKGYRDAERKNQEMRARWLSRQEAIHQRRLKRQRRVQSFRRAALACVFFVRSVARLLVTGVITALFYLRHWFWISASSTFFKARSIALSLLRLISVTSRRVAVNAQSRRVRAPQDSLNHFLLDRHKEPGSHAHAAKPAHGYLVLDSHKRSGLHACVAQSRLNRFLLDRRKEPGSHAHAAEPAHGQLVSDPCKRSRSRTCAPHDRLNRFLLDRRKEPGSHAYAAEPAHGQLVLDPCKRSRARACAPQHGLNRFLLDRGNEPGSRAHAAEPADGQLVSDPCKRSRSRACAPHAGSTVFSWIAVRSRGLTRMLLSRLTVSLSWMGVRAHAFALSLASITSP